MSVAVLVEESSGVLEARRAAVELASQCGFGESDAGRVALVATETATNLLRHAGGGEQVVSAVQRQGRTGIQLLALDRGPGIDNIERCMQDGYSTAGGSGTGLGAIRRLSSETDIYSVRGKGTVVLSRIWPGTVPANGNLFWASVVAPLRGEPVSGDACTVHAAGDEVSVLMADGLGHGEGAAEASRTAVAVFERHPDLPQTEQMERIHGALRSTRGAAVALARLSPALRTVRFTGIGNISGVIVGPAGQRHMVSQPGTVGAEIRRIQEFTYEWPSGSLLLMHSDGIVSHWSLDQLPGLLDHDPAVIAGALYRDFSRRRDDATVLVAGSRPA